MVVIIYEFLLNKLEDIWGNFDLGYFTFKDAIIRKIKEEVGGDIKLDFNANSIELYDIYKSNINWILVIYFVKYIRGYFKMMYVDYNFFLMNVWLI